MKIIKRIALLQMNSVLASPLAWLVLVGFSILVAGLLIPTIDSAAFNGGLYDTDEYFPIISALFTAQSKGLYIILSSIITILIPMMTMGVISQEKRDGTIKLLYSSPIKISSIVIGKFLSTMLFVTLLMSVVFLACITAFFTVENADVGIMTSGFIAIYLLAMLTAAVTLYVSTLSSYPVIDVLGTVALLFGINLIYGQVKDVAIVSDIIYWLSPVNHTQITINGLLLSRTVIYFVGITVMFLFLAYTKLRAEKENKKSIVRLRMINAGIIAITVSIITIFSQPGTQLYHDFSASKKNVLSEEFSEELSYFKDKPVKIVTYVNVILNSSFTFGLSPSGMIKEKQFFLKYFLELPQIEMEYVYYYNPKDLDILTQYTGPSESGKSLDEILKSRAENAKMSVDDFVHVSSLPDYAQKERENRDYARMTGTFRLVIADNKTMPLEYQYDDQLAFPMDENIITVFKRIKEGGVELGFVQGHSERAYLGDAPDSFSKLFAKKNERFSLINTGFNIKSIDTANDKLLDNDFIVIADPKTPFADKELAKITEYLNSGKNMLITTEPGSEGVINPIISMMGIKMLSGKIVHDNSQFTSDIYYCKSPDFIDDFWRANPTEIKGSAGFEILDNSLFEIETILVNDGKDSWLKSTASDAPKGINYPLMLKLTRKIGDSEQVIIISGDSDIFSNDMNNNRFKMIPTANYGLLQGIFKFFSGEDYPIVAPKFTIKDLRTTIPYLDMPYLKALWYAGIPLSFILFAFYKLRSRRQK